MAKPTDLPVWATDATYPAGPDPWANQPTKVEPTSGDQARGFIPFQEPPPEAFNWWMNLVYLWILWLNGLWGTDGSLTLDANADVEVSGDGQYYHGTRTVTISPLQGSPGTNSMTWGTTPGDGIVDPANWWLTVPVEPGRVVREVRVSLKDVAGNGVGITFFQTTRYGGLNSWDPEGGGNFTGNAGTDLLTYSGSTPNVELGAGPFRVTTDGTLPAPLALNTDYYLIPISSTTFKLATSYKNALANIPIDLTTNGTGTHTLSFSSLAKFTIGSSSATGAVQTITRTGNLRLFKGHSYGIKLTGGVPPNQMNLYLLEIDYEYPKPT